MKLTYFLDHIKSSEFFDQNFVFHFTAKTEYPLLFFSFFIKRLKEIVTFEVELLDLNAKDSACVNSKLATMFLGQKKLYCLQDLTTLKGKNRLKWVNYLKNYKGPNLVAFFSDGSVNLGLNKKAIVIELDEFVDKTSFLKIVQFLNIPVSKSFLNIVSILFNKNKALPLDQSCMLINYAFLVGRSYKEFITEWLDKIVSPDQSLFALSQYFFDRNPKLFFTLWLDIKESYSEQFWLTFWSEQIWRACNVVKFMKNRKFAEARQISFRLPFSFTQRSWRKFSVDELKNAHDFIYSVDYSLKNGGLPFSLDLFYSKFLNNQFC